MAATRMSDWWHYQLYTCAAAPAAALPACARPLAIASTLRASPDRASPLGCGPVATHPPAQAVALIGDFNGWSPRNNHWAFKNPFGVWELFLADLPDGSPAIPHRSKVRAGAVGVPYSGQVVLTA